MAFIDDAIRISKYLNDYSTTMGNFLQQSTAGSISVRVNSNRQGNGNALENWIDFHTGTAACCGAVGGWAVWACFWGLVGRLLWDWGWGLGFACEGVVE